MKGATLSQSINPCYFFEFFVSFIERTITFVIYGLNICGELVHSVKTYAPTDIRLF